MSSSNTIYCNYSTFNLIEQREKSRLVAGLLLAVVAVLHVTLAMYLLNVPEAKHKKPAVVMEVVIVPKPESIVKQAVKESPAASPTVEKKSIEPKPVVKPPETIKKPVMVKKSAPVPKPQPAKIKEVMPVPKFVPAPTFSPTPPVAAPTPAAAPSASSNSFAKSKTTQASGHERGSAKTVVSGVVPLVRIPPKYPSRAVNRHIEGWVKVEFTIQTDGSVDDAVVVGSEPEAIFDDSALTAISKWKFKEKIVNGIAVPQRAVQRLQFKLDH